MFFKTAVVTYVDGDLVQCLTSKHTYMIPMNDKIKELNLKYGDRIEFFGLFGWILFLREWPGND